MTAGRLRLANAVIVATLLGSLAAAVGFVELWPFSPYGMYSTIEDGEWVERFAVYGVGGDPPREIELSSLAFLAPLDPGRLRSGLVRLSLQADPEPRYRAVLADLLRRYERRRRAGEHSGPAVHSMRLYRVAWERTDASLSNLDRPDVRELLAVVERRADGEGSTR